MNMMSLNVSHTDVDPPYEAASADVLLLQTQKPPIEWNTMSSLVTCRPDGTITNALEWWKGSQSMYPKLSKMARDVMAVPATSAGVEMELVYLEGL